MQPARTRRIRRFFTRRFNPLVLRFGLAGGRRSPWAIVEHVGRTTGRPYRTPLLPLIAGDFAYFPLTYGSRVPWVQNVRAAGGCPAHLRGRVLELVEPAIVGSAENLWLPAAIRGRLDRTGPRYLRLRIRERLSP